MNRKQNKKQQIAFERQNMPYERFLRFGPQALTESELLAIVLRTGTKGKPALKMAEEILSLANEKREGLLGLYDMTLEDLKSIVGMGEVKAVKVKCLTELSARISAASAKEGLIVNSPGTIAEYFMEKLRHNKTESVFLACFDAKGELIHEEELATGSVNSAVTTPREIFLKAMEQKAVNVILVHNHPSGDPTPSSADMALTRGAAQMGITLGIPLLDHIVIGDNRYVSFKEAGLL